MVAELLLEKETINHDDLVTLIGARPFKAHKSYLEFISAQEDAKQKDTDAAGTEAGAKASNGDSGTADGDSGPDGGEKAGGGEGVAEGGEAAAAAGGVGAEAEATTRSKEP